VTFRRSAEAAIQDRGAEPAVMEPLVTPVLSNRLRSLCSDTWAHATSYSWSDESSYVPALHGVTTQTQHFEYHNTKQTARDI
jgi:hypothetical protein